MKNNIIYHNQDLDGFCSASIIRKALVEKRIKWDEINLIGWNYGDPVPDLDGPIYITDLCLPDEVMIKLMDRPDTEAVTWIDHHKSSIEASQGKWSDMKGKREVGHSASLLAWIYFFGHDNVPPVVKYVDLFDVWKKENPDNIPWQEILEYQYGMRYWLRDPVDQEAANYWHDSFGRDIDFMRGFGIIILESMERDNKRTAEGAFDLKFAGLNFCALNASGNSNIVDYVVREDHDAIMLFRYDQNKWRVSMYGNEKGGIRPDLSILARAMGGGGHRNACGFECSVEFMGAVLRELFFQSCRGVSYIIREDDNLGELDASKACSIDNPECESCQ